MHAGPLFRFFGGYRELLLNAQLIILSIRNFQILKMLSTMKYFLRICDDDLFLKISGSVAGHASLGNSYNLHKSKVAAIYTMKHSTL